MGGPGSGRRSLKLIAVEALMEVQSLMQQLLYQDLESPMTREELKQKVEEYYKQTKVAQEEIERAK